MAMPTSARASAVTIAGHDDDPAFLLELLDHGAFLIRQHLRAASG
jgi:hypothetical protein